MVTIHLIHGFLGAGKTTFSQALARETGALRLNADEAVARRFSEEEQAGNWEACFSQALADIWDETRRAVREGRDVILDIGFWSRASRDDARMRAGEYGARVKHYYVFAPEDVLLERLGRRAGKIAEKNVENFHAYKARFEPPAADEEIILIETGPAGNL